MEKQNDRISQSLKTHFAGFEFFGSIQSDVKEGELNSAAFKRVAEELYCAYKLALDDFNARLNAEKQSVHTAETINKVFNDAPVQKCEKCGSPKDKWVPGGVSKKTGREYKGFMACSNSKCR